MEKTDTILEADLLNSIEAFCTATNTPETTFGRGAVGDPNFIRDLRSGRELRRKTRARVLEFMGFDNDQKN